MESLDREIANVFAESPPKPGPASVLVVGDLKRRKRALASRLSALGHAVAWAGTAREAAATLATRRYDLVLLCLTLADGDGLAIARRLHADAPATRVIALYESDSFPQAVEALRCGVSDLLNVKSTAAELADRAGAALEASSRDRQRADRLAQLEVVCKKLIAAREEVTEHLDTLCKDLAAAYQDVSEQLNDVAMASEFRTLLKQELDLEDLLRTALEYLLGRIGPTNAAVFLPDATGAFDLGAYVNYDCPRETITVLLNHLCRAVCPQMADEPEIVRFEDAEAFAEFIGTEAGFLGGCQVVAFSCRHGGKCLGVMVLFRSLEEPFEDPVAGTLEILRSIFAEQVASVIRIHHRASPQFPKDAYDDEHDVGDYDDFGFGGLVA